MPLLKEALIYLKPFFHPLQAPETNPKPTRILHPSTLNAKPGAHVPQAFVPPAAGAPLNPKSTLHGLVPTRFSPVDPTRSSPYTNPRPALPAV